MVVAQIKTERRRRQKKRVKKGGGRETGRQKENAENFHCLATAGPYGASERREWKRMNKAWNKLRYLFVPRVRLPSLYPARRSVLLQSPPPPIVDPLIPFLHARGGRQSFLEGSSGLFYGVFSTGLGLGCYMKEYAWEIYLLYLSLSLCVSVSVCLTAPRGFSFLIDPPLPRPFFAPANLIHLAPGFPSFALVFVHLGYQNLSSLLLNLLTSVESRHVRSTNRL